MDIEKVQQALKQSELSPYQAEAYVTLLELRDASAIDIVDACTVPQPRIYDVLRALEEKGYVETYEVGGLRARANDPSEVVDSLEERADMLSTAAEMIDATWEQPPAGDHSVSVFSDFEAVVDDAATVVREAKTTVQVASKTSTAVDLRDALRKARESDVLIELSLFTDPETTSIASISALATHGDEIATEIRRRSAPAPFLALVDGTRAYFGVDGRVTSYGMVVADQTLSSMLYWYFQHALWEDWEVVYASDREPLPQRYADIRQCVYDVAPLLEEEHELLATVDGFEMTTGRSCSFAGRIVDVIREQDEAERPRQMSIIVDVDNESYIVGGFGATVEDVRADSIIVNRLQ